MRSVDGRIRSPDSGWDGSVNETPFFEIVKTNPLEREGTVPDG